MTPKRFDLTLVSATGPVPIDDPYLDVAYMPTLGPSPIAMLRHLLWLYHHEYRYELPFEVVAAGCGVGTSRAMSCLDRLVHHQLVDLSVADVIGLPVAVPLLPASMSSNLPVTCLSFVRQFESNIANVSPRRFDLNPT